MATAKYTDLPTTGSASLTDIICALQGGVSGTSVQETLQQVFNLMLSNTILNYAGNPNGNVAGSVYQLCWNTSSNLMYVCTTSGTSSTAVWTLAGSVALPVSAAQGGTGVASPTAHGIAVAEGSGAFTFKTLTNGQLLIGLTGADPVAATLSAGSGISIASGPGTITISGTASSIGWTEVTGGTQTIVADNGYVANNAGTIIFTLPATAAFGTEISIIGKGAGGWKIEQNALQSIQIGTTASTVGTGGAIASSNRYDSIRLICTTANTTWTVLGGPQGNINIL